MNERTHWTTGGLPLPLPLAGVTVVSIEQAVAAPFATRQLADLGARVIRVDRPGGGDSGQSSHFAWLNRSKESITLDVRTPAGREVLTDLLGKADVFVQNLAPGVAGRLSVDAESLARHRPSLIPCSISGPGSPEEPARQGISTADIAGGMYAYTGILTALYRRATTGWVSSVEVSPFDALTEWMGHGIGTPNGPSEALLPPAKLSNAEPLLGPVPAPGEHTDAILRELGRDDDAIAALRADGVV